MNPQLRKQYKEKLDKGEPLTVDEAKDLLNAFDDSMIGNHNTMVGVTAMSLQECKRAASQALLKTGWAKPAPQKPASPAPTMTVASKEEWGTPTIKLSPPNPDVDQQPEQ